MAVRAYVGLGSNLGDRLEYLRQAVDRVKSIPGVSWRRNSPVYETEPVGIKDQPAFLNMVTEVDVESDAASFLAALKAIEVALGRTTRQRWGPREIDLDLLYFGTEVINDGPLRLPHPELARRRFVLVPLRDLAPDLVDPLRKRTVKELLHACPDSGVVRTTQLIVP